MMNVEAMRKQDVTMGDVDFKISKIPAMEAYDLLELARIQLANCADKITPSGNAMVDFIKSVGCLPVEFTNHLKSELFKRVTFIKKSNMVGNNQGVGLPLTSDKFAMAFENLDPSYVYELLIRCLVVNFFYFFKRLQNFANQKELLAEFVQQKQ